MVWFFAEGRYINKEKTKLSSCSLAIHFTSQPRDLCAPLCCPLVAESVLSKEKEMETSSFLSLKRFSGKPMLFRTFQKLMWSC